MTRAGTIIGAVIVGALAFAPAASAITSASVSGGTLTVSGDATANQITVWLGGGDGISPGHDGVVTPPGVSDPYNVDDPAGVSAGAGCSVHATVTTRLVCPRNGSAYGSFTVNISGGEGADYIQAIRPLQAPYDTVNISGGGGGDALFGSQTGDYLSGDGGDDLMDGAAGADFMSGGTILVQLPSPEGGVTQPAGYAGGPGAGFDRVYGGNFDDQITDGDNDTDPAQLNGDYIDGGVCFGGAPADIGLPTGVPAPAGITTCPQLTNNIDGGEDHDAYMLGHRTRPLLIDILIVSASQGAAGENERIRRIEAVWGGSGDDRLYGRDGDLGDESLRGNGGNDYLEARGGDDELIGGDGQDHLIGGAGADILWPGGHIISAPGAPTEMVSDGPDIVDGGTNSTIVGGHSQSDLVTYDGRTDPLRIDMTQPNTLGAPGENDTITGIEDIMGGHRGDTIIGDAVHNLISGDPQPFVFNVPPDPPAYPAAAGGHAGDDHITTRDSGPDTVDCTEGTADVHVSDGLDASINCENRAVPACSDTKDNDGDGKSDFPADPGCESAVDETEAPDPGTGPATEPTIGGPSNAGRITVKKDGSFTLAKNVIGCPKGSAACKVTNAVNAAKGKTKYGSRSYTLKAGAKGAAKSKLTKKRLSTLKKRKSMKARVAVKVVLNGKTKSRTIRVTLKAPKRAKKKR